MAATFRKAGVAVVMVSALALTGCTGGGYIHALAKDVDSSLTALGIFDDVEAEKSEIPYRNELWVAVSTPAPIDAAALSTVLSSIADELGDHRDCTVTIYNTESTDSSSSSSFQDMSSVVSELDLSAYAPDSSSVRITSLVIPCADVATLSATQ